MGIYLLKRGDGWDPRWHGQYMVDGVRKHVSLNLWHGTPPGPGKTEGDAKFERSRGKAQELFEKVKDEGKSTAEEAVLAQKIHAARYGDKVGRVKLAELAAKWDALPRVKVTEERRTRVHSVLRRFAEWMHAHYPRVKDAGALTAKHFREFFAAVEKSGVTPRTWNDVLDILRGVLRRVDCQSRGYREYLADLPKKSKEQRAETVHRRAFTAKELAAIFRAAEQVDPLLRPVIVCAACTALRRGDAAQLRWDDVDMESGFVKVATSKTGEDVFVPIFLPFKAVLLEAQKNRQPGVEYVFPEVAKRYLTDAKWLNRHLEKVLKAAGIEATTAARREGVQRKNRASLSLWHAFRSTFVTFALANGVAPQIIMQVTGHTTDKTMFQFYDRRAADQLQAEMRKAFEGAMPKAIAGTAEGNGNAGETARAEHDVDWVFIPFPHEKEEVARMLVEATPEQIATIEALLKKGGAE